MASQPFQTSTNMMIAKQEESSQETPKETPPKVEGWGRDYELRAGRKKNLAKSSWGELPPKMEYLVLGTSSKYFSALLSRKSI